MGRAVRTYDNTPPILLVGQAPARSMPPDARAFEGSDSLRRLAAHIGHDEDAILAAVQTDNVLRTYPGKSEDGKYDVFPRAEARREADEIRLALCPSLIHTIVIAGRTTADSFGLHPTTPYLLRVQLPLPSDHRPRIAAYIIPHPGGTNRWWNSEANRAEARIAIPRILGLA